MCPNHALVQSSKSKCQNRGVNSPSSMAEIGETWQTIWSSSNFCTRAGRGGWERDCRLSHLVLDRARVAKRQLRRAFTCRPGSWSRGSASGYRAQMDRMSRSWVSWFAWDNELTDPGGVLPIRQRAAGRWAVETPAVAELYPVSTAVWGRRAPNTALGGNWQGIDLIDRFAGCRAMRARRLPAQRGLSQSTLAARRSIH